MEAPARLGAQPGEIWSLFVYQQKKSSWHVGKISPHLCIASMPPKQKCQIFGSSLLPFTVLILFIVTAQQHMYGEHIMIPAFNMCCSNMLGLQKWHVNRQLAITHCTALDSFDKTVRQTTLEKVQRSALCFFMVLTLSTRVDIYGNHLLGNWGDCNTSTCKVA